MSFESLLVFGACACGLGLAYYYALLTSRIKVTPLAFSSEFGLLDEPLPSDTSEGSHNERQGFKTRTTNSDDPEVACRKVKQISSAIDAGATSFLRSEYSYIALFMIVFSLVLLLLLGASRNIVFAFFSVASFMLGALTSLASGFIGMKIATYSNSRTAAQAVLGYAPAFLTAFRAGAVMGFALVSLGVAMLHLTVVLFSYHGEFKGAFENQEQTKLLFEAIAGYGLGGSSVALFGRVGGGIYTKAADVGADLVGKVEAGIPEDDPRNPAVIADNVGDNVGDIAGMGADLFGSLAESTCAAMVISSQSSLFNEWAAMCLPLLISAMGIFVAIATTYFATHVSMVRSAQDIEPVLKKQLKYSTFFTTPVVFVLCYSCLPSSATLNGIEFGPFRVFLCIAAGLWSGLLIGLSTEYYTSHRFAPVRELAASCETGAATNVIYGLSLGYKSTIVPIFCLAATICIGFSQAGAYGIAMAAIGILSTMCIALTIDAFGPICDNAGGIAEMAELGDEVRSITDALDAAGNTTAAIGKGFAIGSAALVSLALFSAFVDAVGLKQVDLLTTMPFAGLLVGAMLPYWFSAMTVKSVGKAALAMVQEVRRQFHECPGILGGTEQPDYDRCIAISTRASLNEMIAPGALVMATPLVVGFLLGADAVAGVLAGALVSGVQMAISASNTGGAWDNAKKYIEAGWLRRSDGELCLKGSKEHTAAVVGDTIGDPLKDTSGPALNILLKLMAIICLVFAPAFEQRRGWLLRIF